MILFAGPPGRVVALQDPGVQGILPLAAVTPNPVTFSARKSIITRVTIAHQTNHQFLHTLGGDIYIYVFGDRIGQMSLSGIALAYDCNNDDGRHGIEKMLDWYKNNKLSARSDPITVMVGLTPITGFVAGFTGAVIDPSLRIAQFDLSLFVLPEN